MEKFYPNATTNTILRLQETSRQGETSENNKGSPGSFLLPLAPQTAPKMAHLNSNMRQL